jgi:hypothetical protein
MQRLRVQRQSGSSSRDFPCSAHWQQRLNIRISENCTYTRANLWLNTKAQKQIVNLSAGQSIAQSLFKCFSPTSFASMLRLLFGWEGFNSDQGCRLYLLVAHNQATAKKAASALPIQTPFSPYNSEQSRRRRQQKDTKQCVFRRCHRWSHSRANLGSGPLGLHISLRNEQ